MLKGCLATLTLFIFIHLAISFYSIYLSIYLSKHFPILIFSYLSIYVSLVISSRWIIKREEWVLNIFIQHQYSVLTDAYCDERLTKIPKWDFYFRTCEDGAGWHLIPYIISPRSQFFSQAYKNWHIMWGINLGPDWPPLARGSKFHTIHTPTWPLNFLPQIMEEYGPIGLSCNNIIL